MKLLSNLIFLCSSFYKLLVLRVEHPKKLTSQLSTNLNPSEHNFKGQKEGRSVGEREGITNTRGNLQYPSSLPRSCPKPPWADHQKKLLILITLFLENPCFNPGVRKGASHAFPQISETLSCQPGPNISGLLLRNTNHPKHPVTADLHYQLAIP